MGKYFSTTLKPVLPVATMIQSNKTDLPFSASDLFWDWFAFDVPKGANRLIGATLLVRGEDGAPQTDRDIALVFGKSDADGTAPTSLGTGNATVNGKGYYNNLLAYATIDITEFLPGLDFMSMAVMGGGEAGNGPARQIVLQGEPNSGTRVGFDKLYIGGIGGASNTWDFSTGVLLNDGDNVAEGDTALVTDGTDADKAFAPGDVILKHDSDTVVGTVKSVSANLITLTSGSGVAITDDDELVNASPITIILGFER